ncbi:MAG: N(4)-(beta-N-acetylglucosaminyl)-L-asparaginase [Fusobacteria bacterium]|nr:N(4)-(beta-N-acetylglucosaminyl)-L-asparaginase [Fusobacteriota bacterium]
MILIANHEGRAGVKTAAHLLKNGNDSLKSIIEGIKVVEADETIRTVGRGGWPNILGEVELDSAVMDGNTLQSGAVGSVRGFAHPVEIAYEVMQRLQYEILVGTGAERFASDIGAKRVENLVENSKLGWQRHLDLVLSEPEKHNFPNVKLFALKSEAVDPEKCHDTTVYLAKDLSCKISTATSTSGWAWKHPGRLGDSPIIGAGSYADSRYGACACTHTGEMAIRLSVSRSVVLYMKMGMSVEEAVYEIVKDLRYLKTGYLSELTIHAMDANDNYKVVSYRGSEPVFYWVYKDTLDAPIKEQAEYIE